MPIWYINPVPKRATVRRPVENSRARPRRNMLPPLSSVGGRSARSYYGLAKQVKRNAPKKKPISQLSGAEIFSRIKDLRRKGKPIPPTLYSAGIDVSRGLIKNRGKRRNPVSTTRQSALRGLYTRTRHTPGRLWNPKRKAAARKIVKRKGRKTLYGAAALAYRKAHARRPKRRTNAALRPRRKNAALTYLPNARRKQRRSPTMAKRKRRRKNAWFGQPRRHAKAARKGWTTRRGKARKKRRTRKATGGLPKTFLKRRRAARRGWAKRHGVRRPRYSARRGYAISRVRKARRSKRRRTTGATQGQVRGLLKANPRRRRRRRNVKRRYGMRPYGVRRNARRRRGGAIRRHLRRNPVIGGLFDTAKQALPVVGAMIAGRLVISQVGGMIPGVDRLGTHKAPVLHALMAVVGAFATRKVLTKWRSGIMIGLGVNLVESLIRTYAPAQVKGMIGVGANEGVYDEALSGPIYQELGDYVETGDYIETSGEENLSDMTQGLEEELGDYVETSGADVYEELGADPSPAVMRGRMLAAPATRRMMAPIPEKSFVETVPRWTAKWDQKKLYSGIFSGGWC